MRKCREIKFRGIRVDNGEWVYGSLFTPKYKNCGEAFIIPDYAELLSGALMNLIEVIPETVGQSTGLKENTSKKWIKLFGGDIIEFDDTEIGGDKCVGEIIWCDDQALGNLEWGLWTKDGYYRTNFLGKIKLLGNKHENGDLLK